MARLETLNNMEYPIKFSRLVKSYRSKIRRYTEPGTSFSIELVIGCSIRELFDYVQAHMTSGMTWENYGSYWWFSNMESPKEYNLQDPDQFLGYFNYRSFRPLLADDAGGIGSKAKGLPILKGGQVINPQNK